MRPCVTVTGTRASYGPNWQWNPTLQSRRISRRCVRRREPCWISLARRRLGEDALPQAPVIRVARGDDGASATAAVSSPAAGAALPADRRHRLRALVWSLLGVALLSGSVAVIASERASGRGERSVAIVPLQNGSRGQPRLSGGRTREYSDREIESSARPSGDRDERHAARLTCPPAISGALGRRVGVTALLTGRLMRERDTLRFSFEVVRGGGMARVWQGEGS